MHLSIHYTPLFSPSPPPAPATNEGMVLSVFFVLFLPCAGMSVVFIVYIFLVRFSSCTQVEIPEKPVEKKGLSEAELEKLPKMTGKELVMGNECAVCLDEIEREDVARVVPGCNHGFHLECADAWLSRSCACPVCRAKIDSQLLSSYCNQC